MTVHIWGRLSSLNVRKVVLAASGSEVELACAVRDALEADGMLATCLQHEMDHLNGVLFTDHISKLKRDRVMKKFTKLAKEKERARIRGMIRDVIEGKSESGGSARTAPSSARLPGASTAKKAPKSKSRKK